MKTKPKHRLKDFEKTLVIPGGTVVWQPIGFCRRIGVYYDQHGHRQWNLDPLRLEPWWVEMSTNE